MDIRSPFPWFEKKNIDSLPPRLGRVPFIVFSYHFSFFIHLGLNIVEIIIHICFRTIVFFRNSHNLFGSIFLFLNRRSFLFLIIEKDSIQVFRSLAFQDWFKFCFIRLCIDDIVIMWLDRNGYHFDTNFQYFLLFDIFQFYSTFKGKNGYFPIPSLISIYLLPFFL